MNISDLPLEHEQVLDIAYQSRWLDSLLESSHHRRCTRSHQRAEASSGNRVLAPPPDTGLRTVVAARPEQLQAARQLVRRRYAWRGYQCAILEEFEVGNLGADGRPVTLLAEDHGTLLATLTVRPDSSQGLQAEQTYGTEIERLRSEGRRVGELVKLAVEEGADWKAALDALVQASYLVTRVIHALTDVLIEVNPRHVRFYRKVFGFVIAGAERLCGRVGAPSVLMRLDLEQFGRRLGLSPQLFPG